MYDKPNFGIASGNVFTNCFTPTLALFLAGNNLFHYLNNRLLNRSEKVTDLLRDLDFRLIKTKNNFVL